jgi:protein-disulfide isomerase
LKQEGEVSAAGGQGDRERLRADREAQAAEAAARERRNRRLWQLGATLVVAAALVATAIAISTSGGRKAAQKPAATQSLLGGIPQHGVVLGNPNAPVTMTEFADLQCPFCREYTVSVMPSLVARYVRTGKVKMVFRNVAILGGDSEKAARFAAAAGLQNKLWDVADRMYQEQGQENSGYVNNGFIERIGGEVRGLDVPRALAVRDSAAVTAQLRQASGAYDSMGVSGTPSFFLQRGSGKPSPLQYSDYEPSQFASQIEAALRSG